MTVPPFRVSGSNPFRDCHSSTTIIFSEASPPIYYSFMVISFSLHHLVVSTYCSLSSTSSLSSLTLSFSSPSYFSCLNFSMIVILNMCVLLLFLFLFKFLPFKTARQTIFQNYEMGFLGGWVDSNLKSRR